MKEELELEFAMAVCTVANVKCPNCWGINEIDADIKCEDEIIECDCGTQIMITGLEDCYGRELDILKNKHQEVHWH